MDLAHHLVFGPLRVDPQARKLWRGDQPVPLQPRPLAVLCYLCDYPDRVVTAEELLQQVWQGTHVTKTALKVCIRTIREALGEDAEHPEYLETVGREGYRFRPTASGVPLTPAHGPLPTPVVGRDPELQHLARGLTSAMRGVRQVLFVTGEPGIGKTTLVDCFLAQVEATGRIGIGRGQCLEQYGEGEAYLPVLEALWHWCRGPGGQQVLAGLQRYAPTWLVQMPALLTEAERDRAQRQAAGATRERMVREMAEALEALTADRALVLVLEDLHWSDKSTVDLLAYLAQRRTAARLLLLGTYRPTDLVLRQHPLHGVKQELQAHGQCAEVRLAVMTAGEVETYVRQRLGLQEPPPAGLAEQVYRRTDGNPLFMVNVVEQYLQQGRLEEDVPTSVQELISRQFARLSAEAQRVLAVGSVAGIEFTAALVAEALQDDADVLEDLCEELAQTSHFIQAAGIAEWPDGTLSGCYRFRYALYQQVLYQRLGKVRRLQLHRQIGLRLEAGYGAQAGEQAAALAMHFDQGRDYPRAVRYRQQAAQTALHRHAYPEAIGHLSRGLELLATLPETPERAQQELALQIALGPALRVTKGSAAPEVEQTYARARALCAQVGETPQLFSAVQGLQVVSFNRGMLPTARELGEQLDRLAQRTADPMHRLEAHYALGITLFYLGNYATARTHCEQGIAGIDPTALPAQVLYYGPAPGVGCLALAAHTLWCLGYPAQALRRSQEALALARTLVHPYSLALAQYYAASLHHRRGEIPAVQAQAEALLALATAQGFPLWAGLGTFWRGWALAMQGQDEVGLAQMRQGVAGVLATGETLARPICLVPLAEALGHTGQAAEGLSLLAEARAGLEARGQGDLLAAAYRLQGVLLLQQAVPEPAQAEACFQQALAVAHRQQARSWELRAALSLSRLWQQQGKRQEAHDLLAEVYGWFTEGFDTADLQEAQALLNTLI
jgi:predicted ATPase/DNA-binding winged helix-turn-helix (wHTH) protein